MISLSWIDPVADFVKLNKERKEHITQGYATDHMQKKNIQWLYESTIRKGLE